jgi:hypothetical protein
MLAKFTHVGFAMSDHLHLHPVMIRFGFDGGLDVSIQYEDEDILGIGLRLGRNQRLRRVQVTCGKRVVDDVTIGGHDCFRTR